MEGRAQEPSKFINYFELRDTFHEDGCPICRLLVKWTRGYLNSLFHEYVNDPWVRQKLLNSHGFCNWHAWMAATIENSPSGIAIIYEHLLKDRIETLRRFTGMTKSKSRWARLRAKWRPREDRWGIPAWLERKAACAACERMSLFFERNLIDTLVAHITDRDFADGFRRSPGLCLPHLYQAIAAAQDHPNMSLVLDLQLEKLVTLRGELREYIRKLDYRFIAEPRGIEQSAWRRAIELFVGGREVFGPDRRLRERTARRSPVPMPPVAAENPEPEPTSSVVESGEHPRGERLAERGRHDTTTEA
jgi:hypothetical protein